ncbi:hypothetical protein [Siphonobacter sp. SORGH_AS_1065]|uniref:hypothetical protein n=1 Tax=Siphonobacter sp. SORGH_AS_1065 TaxID=3041795 RepID=UPI002788E22F|nr:hypothetical protein [Siphonobacter sp. SORGH_AS_1065]MDQ1088976.1 hypothetical protein [Siphonobacter sp. SORGH_AS_1065]
MKYFSIFLLSIFSLTTFAQVGIGTSTPHSSAQLEISSPNKGLLIPRITKQNRPGSPGKDTAVAGLMIYQIDQDSGFYVYDGKNWDRMVRSSEVPNNSYLYAWDNRQGYVLDYNNYKTSNTNRLNLAVAQNKGSAYPVAVLFPTYTSSPDIKANYSSVSHAYYSFQVNNAGYYQLTFSITPDQTPLGLYFALIYIDNNPLAESGVYSVKPNYTVNSTSIAYIPAGAIVELKLTPPLSLPNTIHIAEGTQGVKLYLQRLR